MVSEKKQCSDNVVQPRLSAPGLDMTQLLVAHPPPGVILTPHLPKLRAAGLPSLAP